MSASMRWLPVHVDRRDDAVRRRRGTGRPGRRRRGARRAPGPAAPWPWAGGPPDDRFCASAAGGIRPEAGQAVASRSGAEGKGQRARP